MAANKQSKQGNADRPTEPEDGDEEELPEAAPTDFRRNLWLLYVMVAVVVVAWLASLLAR